MAELKLNLVSIIYYKVFSVFNIHNHYTIGISIFEERHPHTKVNYPFNG